MIIVIHHRYASVNGCICAEKEKENKNLNFRGLGLEGQKLLWIFPLCCNPKEILIEKHKGRELEEDEAITTDIIWLGEAPTFGSHFAKA